MSNQTNIERVATGIEMLNLDALSLLCHNRSVEAGWYNNNDRTPKDINKGERLMLIVSEIAECMEGERKDLMDDHLPERKMAEVELADAIIRICDYAGFRGYNLSGAVADKLEYNLHRADHKIENRNKENGKQF